ncbi:MAG: helix-turn-helix domain-containing protein [Wenzhouxiangellaceae bacterium]|nr:helix-turn-helix domain-containing protein [Wenzhouxiangellaceae bacterium]
MSQPGRAPCLRDVVARSVSQYLADMGSTPPDDLYQRIVEEVERPLFRTVLDHTDGNQSKAARILGLTRSTLRSRIRKYDL